MKSLKSRTLLCAGICAVMAGQYAEAQGCNTSVMGYYSYSSIGDGVAGSLLNGSTSTGIGTTTGTGTGTTTGVTGSGTAASNYSNTGVGNLLNGLSGSSPFATAGSWYFSSGTIFASPATDRSAQQQIGTYTLNSDCTISVTLNDAFNTGTSKQPSATLQGMVLRGGADIVLGVLENTPASTTTTTTGSSATTTTGSTTGTQTVSTNGLLQTSTLIELTRSASPSACSTSGLVGRYGMVARGVGVASTSTGTVTGTATSAVSGVAPFFLFGVLQFDGNGNVVAPSASTSPLGYLEFTGTYKVNADCTGTMTLGIPTTVSSSGISTGTGTSTGIGTGTTTSTGTTGPAANLSTTTLNFVLTEPEAEVSPSGEAPLAGQAKPMITFSGASGSQTLEGYASQL